MKSVRFCQLEKQSTGKWMCVNCGARFDKDLWAKCGSPGRVKVISHHDYILSIFEHHEYCCKDVDKEEALRRYSICRQCSRFNKFYCNQDTGCDKGKVFIIRILRRDCKGKWDNESC